MHPRQLNGVWFFCFLMIEPTISQDFEVKCNETHELVFAGREQPQMLAQKTVIKLIWMIQHCFQQDDARHAELAYFADFAEFYEGDCSFKNFELRHQAEARVAPDTNVARFLLEYNQLYYESCRAILIDEFDTKMKEADKEAHKFSFKSSTIQYEIIEKLLKERRSFDLEDVRLKTAFQLLQNYADLTFMEKKDFPFFTRRKMLFKEFEKIVGASCKQLLDIIETDALNLIKLHSLTIRAPRLNNPWIKSYLFCRTSLNRLTIWNIDEEWERAKKLPDLDLSVIKAIDTTETSVIVGGNLGDKEPGERNPRNDEDAFEVAFKQLLLTLPDKPSVSLIETSDLIVDVMMFYEKWKMQNFFAAMRAFRNLAAIGMTHCRPAIIKTRAGMVAKNSNSNITRYASFYNELQYKLCLDNIMTRLVDKFTRKNNVEQQQFISRLTSLGLAAYTQHSAGNKGPSSATQSAFLSKAALDYLIKYGSFLSLPQKTQKKIFQLFETKIKQPCKLFLDEYDYEIAMLNIILEVSKPAKRSNLVIREAKPILMGAKMCRFYILHTKDRKLHSQYKQIEGSMERLTLNEDKEPQSFHSDLSDVDLFYEPEFNSNEKEIFVITEIDNNTGILSASPT